MIISRMPPVSWFPDQTMKRSTFPARRAVLLLAWAASLAGAYYIGNRREPQLPSRKAGVLASIGERPGHGQTSPGARKAALATALAALPSDDESEEEDIPSGASDVKFPDMLAEIQAMPPGVKRNTALFKLMRHWAAADGPGALAAAATITEPKLRSELRETALRSWASASPAAAWQAASENKNGDLPDSRMELVFAGFGRSDPAKVLAFFDTHGKEMLAHGDRAALVMDELYERGHHDALVGWADKMPPGKLRDLCANRILDRWARYDPLAAKSWMEQNPGAKENLVPARVELAESWARVNPAAALQWANSLPENQRDSEYYSRIYGRWIQYDRNAAANYLASQPLSPALDRPIERYTYEVMRQNPADTMPWAESISDGKRRWEAISRVAEVWRRRDPAALANYVSAGNFSAEQQQKLLNKDRK